MPKAYLKMLSPILLLFLLSSKSNAAVDTIPGLLPIQNQPQPLFYLDEKEVPNSMLKGIDPISIEKTEIIKSSDAVKNFGVRARFGVVKIISRKKMASVKNGSYSLKLYYSTDTSKYVAVQNYVGKNLTVLCHDMIKEHPNASLAIDELRFCDETGNCKYLEAESSFINLAYSNYWVDSISKNLAELIFYGSRQYKTGKFYFSGNYFRNVTTCNATDANCIENNLKKCAPGTIIILEGCQYKNKDNGFEFVNKKIQLD